MTGGDGLREERDRVLAAQKKRFAFLKCLYDNLRTTKRGRIPNMAADDVGAAIGVTDAGRSSASIRI